MKRLLILLYLIASNALADPTPAYWWKITAQDTNSVKDWGSGSNMTYQPSLLSGPTLITNVSSSYCQFDGLSQYLEASSLDFSTCGKWMCSMWLYDNPGAGYGGPINAGMYNFAGWYFIISPANETTACIDGIQEQLVYATEYFVQAKWTHMVVYFDGSLPNTDKIQTWKNGVRMTTQSQWTTVTNVAATTHAVQIGQYGWGFWHWDGYIDDVRIYTNATDITTNLIPTLHSNGPAPDVDTAIVKPWKFVWKWGKPATPWNYPSGLIGRWSFTNGWTDSVGNNNGTGHGGAHTWSDGTIGYAGANNVTDYANTPTNYANVGLFSISVWTITEPFLDAHLYPPIMGLGTPYSVFVLGGNYYGAAVRCIYFTDYWNWRFQTDTDTFNDTNDGDRFRHIVITYDKNASPAGHIYKDGVDMHVNVVGTAGDLANFNLNFFNRVDNIEGFYGSMSELAVFNKVLSSTEVTSIYNNFKNTFVMGTDITTNMTSNTTPSPCAVTASSVYGGYFEYSAFNNTRKGGYGWLTGYGHPNDNWIMYDFGTNNEKTVNQYRVIGSGAEADAAPKDWALYGSNYGARVKLDEQHGKTEYNALNVDEFLSFTNTTPYRYYIWEGQTNQGSIYYMSLRQLRFYQK